MHAIEDGLLEASTPDLLGACTSLLARQFSIPAPLFAELRRRHEAAGTEAELWRLLIAAAAARAVAPISGFLVGCGVFGQASRCSRICAVLLARFIWWW